MTNKDEVEFDFGQLNKSEPKKPKPSSTSKPRRSSVTKSQVAQMIDEARRDLLEQIHDNRGQVDELRELWQDVLKTIVRMWGTKNGIGAKAMRITTIIGQI